MRDCHRAVSAWLEPLGVAAAVDPAGNLRAYYPGQSASAPRLLLGSHLDTVPNAGAYDGVLGLVLGIALLEELGGERLPFAIELVGFSEEEGVRFGTPFIGSRALVGRIDEDLLGVRDRDGIALREAIEQFGLDPRRIADALMSQDVLAFLEFHIEQGPTLENLRLPLAAVEGIVGQRRSRLTFRGQTNHAGTTAMTLRRDALAGAAEWMVAAEREARGTPGLLATVGVIEARPGATNVVPGEACLTLDLRHGSDPVLTGSQRRLLELAQEIAARRRLSFESQVLLEQPAVAMDPFLTAQVEEAIRSAGCIPHRMPSGAGHDAMILAERVPAAMVFLRSPGGISHDPLETVWPEDVAHAIDAGVCLLKQLAFSRAFLLNTRTSRA
jgi:allantoate deiminase